MPRTLKLIISLMAPLVLVVAPVLSQRRHAPVDQIKLGQRFFAQEEKCRALLRNERWKDAEAACKVAARLADQFADYRELEKMGAYLSVGHALMGQGRFQESIRYYYRALELSRPRLDDTNAEVGNVYVNLALAHHGLRELDKARELYRKAAKTYQTAYSAINEEEVTEEGVEIKRGYLRALKKIYEYHLLAAEQAGATAEAQEIKEQMEGLPK